MDQIKKAEDPGAVDRAFQNLPAESLDIRAGDTHSVKFDVVILLNNIILQCPMFQVYGSRPVSSPIETSAAVVPSG